MESDLLNITTCTEKAIRARVFPGCVVGVVRKKGLRKILPFGNLTYEPESLAVQGDTIYDVASVTKSIPTAMLALMLIEQGKLKLTDKLIDHVPEYRNSYRKIVAIKHLLTYTIGGPQLSRMKDRTLDEILESAYSFELTRTPGSVFAYSNAPALLLGIAVERAGGDTLDKLAQEYFFGPLGMNRTTFHPQRDRAIYRSVAPTEIEKGGEPIGLASGRTQSTVDGPTGLTSAPVDGARGIVHDESARVFAKEEIVVGHAGLFSTVPDILNFMEMLLHEGEYMNKQYFSSEIIREMSTNQIPGLGESTGLGFELKQPFMGKYAGKHTFGKTGFTGTSFVCDIEKGIALVILSNRTYPARPKDRGAIDAFRAGIADMVFRP
jgi:CubicO group peptidase (beta-lactamase class C family)